MTDFTLVIEDAAQPLCPGIFLAGGKEGCRYCNIAATATE